MDESTKLRWGIHIWYHRENNGRGVVILIWANKTHHCKQYQLYKLPTVYSESFAIYNILVECFYKLWFYV